MKKQWQNEFPLQDEFEKTVSSALKLNNFSGLTSDEEFLTKLNQRLKYVPDPVADIAKLKPQRLWVSGICNGVVAMALGVVLLTGLEIMPPLFVDASMAGADFVQEKIVQISMHQQIRWQQFLINLENAVQSK